MYLCTLEINETLINHLKHNVLFDAFMTYVTHLITMFTFIFQYGKFFIECLSTCERKRRRSPSSSAWQSWWMPMAGGTDNGTFRPKYHSQLARIMAQKMPGRSIQPTIIDSQIKTLKRTFHDEPRCGARSVVGLDKTIN